MNQMVVNKPGGSKALFLVLEPGNLHRLKQGDPIRVRLEDSFPDGMPPKLELLISYSDTPVTDAREIARQAEVVFDERAAVIAKQKPHCPECRSTVEQLGVWRSDTSPMAIVYCPVCGCTLGMMLEESLRQALKQIGAADAPHELVRPIEHFKGRAE